MTRHILRRLIQAIPTLFGITFLTYLLMAASPSDPVSLMAFGDPEITQTERDALAETLGLDEPWYIQYLVWLTGNDWMWWKYENGEFTELRERYGIIRGDFDLSFNRRVGAMDLIIDRLPATIELGIATLLVSILLGIPIGIGAAVWQGKIFDNGSRIMAVLGQAIPNFWFGLLLIIIIGINFDQLWARGDRCDRAVAQQYVDPTARDADGRRVGATCRNVPITERYMYLILPTIVLAYGGVAGYSRFMRTSMLDTINSDYIRTARAKGLNARVVWFKHAARNALIPIATFLGPAIVGIVGGAVVTEQIFNWPGLGQLYIESIARRDYPVIMASVVISSILVVVAYIISDILYALFDPRIRF
ncbi:MAG: ABC transporter permease [Chloroflexota bacterium]